MKRTNSPKPAPYEPARTRLSRNLVRVRGELGISQEELADRAGFHRTYVGHLEQRKRNPSLENVERLALTLNVDVLDLLAPTQADV
ncbi:MAG TPA: helix-turn-helix transcriptional regulator [Pseudorhodoferax sp.]|nr:helix-turn-helix transcriptional regulator [Pseudorhodoferax sp.]